MQETQSRHFTIYLPDSANLEVPVCNQSHSWQKAMIARNTTERLIEIDAYGKITLNLLESCSISTDGLSYRFQLRKGFLFWDKTEITTEDVIQSLIFAAGQKNSVSDLGKLLKFKGKSIRKSFKKNTRYRFEVFLEKPVGDLLSRLALAECAIFKSQGKSTCSHPKVFSGPWQLKDSSPEKITFERIKFHPKAKSCPYDFFHLKSVGFNEAFDYNQKAPYAILFPGADRRIPRTNSLVDYQSFSLNMGLSLYITLDSTIAHPGLQNQFWRIAKEFLGKKKNWNRFPLKSFLPLGHKMHQQYTEKLRGNPESPNTPLRIKTPENIISFQFLERFSNFAKEKGMDIQFLPESKLETKKIQEKCNGTLKAFHYSGFFDLYSAPFYLLENYANIYQNHIHARKKLKRICAETDDQVRIRDFASFQKDTLDNTCFLPFSGAPITVITNREYENSEQQNSMVFHRFGESKVAVEEMHHSQETLAAIGSAVQMFAHDVKKPFSMIHGVLSLLETTSDPDKIKSIAQNFLPEVRKTVLNVQGLIFDIAEIGSNLDILPEPLSAKNLVLETLGEVFFLEKRCDIHFRFDFQHTLLLEGDKAKIARVFSNIIGNAKEAMGTTGEICISSTEKEISSKKMIEFSIRNSGTFIPPIERDRIFESFYTKGKKGGTGLGLAISKKVIEKHGGEIWCHSDLNEGTAFYFTLPCARELEIAPQTPFPQSSLEFSNEKSKAKETPRQASKIPNATLESIRKKGSLKILVVDDELVYINIIKNLVESLRGLEGVIQIDEALDSTSALAKLEKKEYDLIFVDVDLGNDSSDGFELTKRCRQYNIKSKICIHSNRGAFALQKKALDCGADLCLPKPISREVLIKLFEDVFKPTTQKQIKPLVVVDDDILVLDAWENCGHPTITYESPEELFFDLEKNVLELEHTQGIITDYIFKNSQKNGVDVAKHLRSIKVPIYLSSDFVSINQEEASLFKKILPKDTDAILRYLGEG